MLNLNCKLIKIIKKIMIHDFYKKLNLFMFYMKFNKHNCIVYLKRYSC